MKKEATKKTRAAQIPASPSAKALKCSKTCPIAQASALVGDMWVILIVRELLQGPRRFTVLREALVPCDSNTPINTRTLTARLESLEKSEILSRIEYLHEMPPRVEYSLTPKGRALSKIVTQLKVYGEKYL